MSSDLLPQQGYLPRGWKWATLSEIALINPPKRRKIPHNPDTPVTFVPMPSVCEDSGTITWAENRPLTEVSRGYTYFEEGDVLFAKITPCMQNGKHAIARGLANGFGFGTTEFHVIRPGDSVSADWIHRFLRQPWLLEEATRYFRGAVGQQRVPKEFLIDLRIPLPPLAEQKRIVAVLNEQMAAVERAKRAADERMEAVKALREVLLTKVWPAGEGRLPSRWKWVKVADIARIDYGYTASADRSAMGPRFLRITDIQDGTVHWEQVPFCVIDKANESKKSLNDGDIVFARTGATTGKSFLVRTPPRAVFASYLLRVRASCLVSPDYLKHYFNSNHYWAQIKSKSRGAAQPNVNSKLLGSLTLPLPPLSEQSRITSKLDTQMSTIERIESSVNLQLQEIMGMPSSLFRLAFSGGL